MAFASGNMRLISAGGSCNLFLYHTSDPIATVEHSGYFCAYHDNLKTYDAILYIDLSGVSSMVLTVTDVSATTSGVTVVANKQDQAP